MTITAPITDHLAVAERIGNLLCRDAIWDGERCNWMGWTMSTSDGNWTPAKQAQPPTLYDGTAGIAIFLAELYRATHEPLHLEAAVGALAHARHRVASLPAELAGSLHNGPPGIAWASLRIGEILERPDLVVEGVSLLRSSSPDAVEPGRTDIDVIAGAAGLVPALIQAGVCHGASDLVDRAVELAHGLVELAAPCKGGVAWATGSGEFRSPNLLGHAHGSSGIALALIEAHAVAPSDRLVSTATAAFEFERGHFDLAHRNWPDLRHDGAQPGFMAAWCHGAPGIGLSRLRFLEAIGYEAAIAEDLEHALVTTAASLQQSANFSLCHGAGGNAELLLLAADSLGRSELRDASEQAGRLGAAQFHDGRLPWPCGVQGAGETPNLMLGLAGIGHFYLRLHDSASVESVLLIRGLAKTSAVAAAAQQAFA